MGSLLEKGDARIERLIEARNQARQAKDIARADALREQRQALGVQLADSPAGTRWKRAEGTARTPSRP